VLVLRKSKSKQKPDSEASKIPKLQLPAPATWKNGATLALVSRRTEPGQPSALVLDSLDDVRWAVRRAPSLSSNVRAIIAPYIPSGMVTVLAGLGILALTADAESIEKLRLQTSLGLPPPDKWDGSEIITAAAGNGNIDLRWRAVGAERQWTAAGNAHPPAPAGKSKP
jgi:hypothetical protein